MRVKGIAMRVETDMKSLRREYDQHITEFGGFRKKVKGELRLDGGDRGKES